jgi:hypothetical protein
MQLIACKHTFQVCFCLHPQPSPSFYKKLHNQTDLSEFELAEVELAEVELAELDFCQNLQEEDLRTKC